MLGENHANTIDADNDVPAPDGAGTATAGASRLNVLRNLSIGVRIWALVGLSVVALAALGGVTAVSQVKSEANLTTLNAFRAIGKLTDNLEISSLQMRRSEKDFLLRNDPKYRGRYQKAEKNGLKTLAELRALPAAQPIGGALQALADGMEKHNAQFETVFGLKEKLGFDEKSGLQGELRKAVHGVETRLKAAKLDNLTVKMLMMRRHEKDFMMRGAAKYIGRIDKRQAEFKTLLAGSDLPPTEQKAIGDLLDRYVADFKAFAATSGTLAGEIKKLSTIFAEMAPSFDKAMEFARTSQQAAGVAHDEAVRSLTVTMIALAATILVVSLLAGFFIARSILGPMTALTDATGELADGNTDVLIEGAEYRDETGRMAGALEIFRRNMIETARLEAEQREAENKAQEEEKRRTAAETEAAGKQAAEQERTAEEQRQRTEKMEEIIAEFDRDVSGALEAVSSAATEMQASAESMSKTAETTTQQSSAMAAASEEASTNMQTVASAAEELSASVDEIRRQVGESTSISQKAVTEAVSTNEKVQGLADAAQKIGEVVNLINDIASQTNLLALNATIEAARAGDAGKGFAVVASEVKSLATQTGKATEEIGGQIVAIQEATTEAVGAIGGISAVIGQINEIAAAISAAVDQQGASTREIAGNVQQAAAGTQEVNTNINDVNQAAGETGESARQVLGAAEELAKQGETLRGRVDTFLTSIRAA